MTAYHIVYALRKKYSLPEWVSFDELRSATGYHVNVIPQRTIDFFTINTYPYKGKQVIAFEIKVSKSDFTTELNDPDKRKFFVEHSTQFYFITPKELLDIDLIPEECGLMEVYESGRIYTKKTAEKREYKDFPYWFLTSILRRTKEGQLAFNFY